MSDGMAAQSESMQRTSIRLQEAIEDAQGETKNLAPTEVTVQEFGRAYGEHHAGYASGFETLGNAVKGLCQALSQFSGKVGDAGAGYANIDSANAAEVNQVRGD